MRVARRPRGPAAGAVPIAVLGCLLGSLLLSGCGLTHLQDLNFRVDNRLHFLSPPSRSLQNQPVTVRWKIDDFTVAAPGSAPPSRHAGYFALFVDQAPIKPGQTMKAVAHGDRFCEHTAGCPDKAYLAAHQVFTTTATSFRLPLIPSITGVKDKIQLHAVTIVLMDTAGRRIGESAWELDFRLRKVGV